MKIGSEAHKEIPHSHETKTPPYRSGCNKIPGPSAA